MSAVLLSLAATSWEEAIRAAWLAEDLLSPVPALGAGWPLAAWKAYPHVEPVPLTPEDPAASQESWAAVVEHFSQRPLLVIDLPAVLSGDTPAIPLDWVNAWPGPRLAVDWGDLLTDDLALKGASTPSMPDALVGFQRLPAVPACQAGDGPAWKAADPLLRLQADDIRQEIRQSFADPDRPLVVVALHPVSTARAAQTGRALYYPWLLEALRLHLAEVSPCNLVVMGLKGDDHDPALRFIALPTPDQIRHYALASDLIIGDTPWHPAFSMAVIAGSPAVVAGSSGEWQEGRLLSPHPDLWPPVANALVQVAEAEPQSVFAHETFPLPRAPRIGARHYPVPYYQADLLHTQDTLAMLRHFLLHAPTRDEWRERTEVYLRPAAKALSAQDLLEAL